MPKKSSSKKVSQITDLIQDPRNINKGTEEGADLIDRSIDEAGFGRSVVVDKNNVLIGGNKIVSRAAAKGKTKIKIVESNGDELIVVRRNDITIDSEKGVKLKILDNTTHQKNYVQDAVVSQAIVTEVHIDPQTYGLQQLMTGDSKKQIEKIPVKKFNKTHVLLSFAPERLVEIAVHLDRIMKVAGVEVEQSSN